MTLHSLEETYLAISHIGPAANGPHRQTAALRRHTKARWRALFAQLLRKQGLSRDEIAAALECAPSVISRYLQWPGEGLVSPNATRKNRRKS